MPQAGHAASSEQQLFHPHLHSMLAHCIDYAGLFPPAGLSMEQSVRNYADYLRGEDSWALGKFVISASRLNELSSALEAIGNEQSTLLRSISALVGGNIASDLESIRRFYERHHGIAIIDAVDAKVSSVQEINALVAAVGGSHTLYCEIPIDGDLEVLIGAIAAQALRAKVRTGGITKEAFPSAEKVLSFIAECLTAKIPFKATAGLHHPLRAQYSLTYEPGSQKGTMFGYLNIILASVFLYDGLDRQSVLEILTEPSASTISLVDDGAAWRNHHVPAHVIHSVREQFFISFGSCSFREPLDDLRNLVFTNPQ